MTNTPTKDPNKIILKGSDYEWPDYIPLEFRPAKKPTVVIDKKYVISEFETGATWEMMERYYAVDVTTLKKLLFVEYEKAIALLKMSIIRSTVLNAIQGNHHAQKFLCTNWLDLEASPQSVAVKEVPYNAAEVDEKLNTLLAKLNITNTKGK